MAHSDLKFSDLQIIISVEGLSLMTETKNSSIGYKILHTMNAKISPRCTVDTIVRQITFKTDLFVSTGAFINTNIGLRNNTSKLFSRKTL